MHKLLGLSSGRGRDKHRRRRAQLGEGGQHDRSGRLANRDDGVVDTEEIGDGSLAGKQTGKGPKRAGAHLRLAHARVLNRFNATSGPSESRHSTASAATSTATEIRARSAREARFST